jgi:hypothetical protein
MDLPVNRFKARLRAGEQQIGLWNSIPGPVVAEAIATAGGVEALLTLLGIEGESELHAVRALHVLADYAGSHGALAGGLESLVSLTARSSEGEGGRLAVLTVHKMAASGDAIAASALASSGATIALLVKQVREGSVEEQTAAARSLRFLCAHEASRATIVGVEESKSVSSTRFQFSRLVKVQSSPRRRDSCTFGPQRSSVQSS